MPSGIEQFLRFQYTRILLCVETAGEATYIYKSELYYNRRTNQRGEVSELVVPQLVEAKLAPLQLFGQSPNCGLLKLGLTKIVSKGRCQMCSSVIKRFWGQIQLRGWGMIYGDRKLN